MSGVVANCLMNRERQAFGDNSYQQDIYINPYVYIKDRMDKEEKVRWLDMCCGRGKALIQVMTEFVCDKMENKVEFWGVDLVSMFDLVPNQIKNINLIESSLMEFETRLSFDLITCVHGLHYIGDKLAIIKKYIQYLKPDSLFVCNLDTNNMFDKDGKKLGRKVNSALRTQGLEYDIRKKLIRCLGNKTIELPFQFLGADDQFGKNYTGQKVVSSYYEYLN